MRSVNLDFFAARDDQRAVLEFLFSSGEARVFESYSEFGQELREFRSTEEVDAAYPLGGDPHCHGNTTLLCLWCPSVLRDLTITRFALNPAACDGHTFRHRIEGGGPMHLPLGGASCPNRTSGTRAGHGLRRGRRMTEWLGRR
ncbi:MAG: hypothetical protein K2W96_10060 [Gemmataceae bacterium]|nr:hypothetical protein [Gemmataceae bacterium]